MGSLRDTQGSCVCSTLMAKIAARAFLFNRGQRWSIDILSMTITAYYNISLVSEREITSSQPSSLDGATCRKETRAPGSYRLCVALSWPCPRFLLRSIPTLGGKDLWWFPSCSSWHGRKIWCSSSYPGSLLFGRHSKCCWFWHFPSNATWEAVSRMWNPLWWNFLPTSTSGQVRPVQCSHSAHAERLAGEKSLKASLLPLVHNKDGHFLATLAALILSLLEGKSRLPTKWSLWCRQDQSGSCHHCRADHCRSHPQNHGSYQRECGFACLCWARHSPQFTRLRWEQVWPDGWIHGTAKQQHWQNSDWYRISLEARCPEVQAGHYRVRRRLPPWVCQQI